MELAYARLECLPIRDMSRLRPGTRCLCRNDRIVQYIGYCRPQEDDCYIFCSPEGTPFRVYANGRYVLSLDSPQDVLGRLAYRGCRYDFHQV